MIHYKITSALIVLASLFTFKQAQAYPDFIGYAYSSCITCHYNGLGGGALNDYGRALYATEITARDIYPKNVDEEEIAAQSGFLGKKSLPWWVRPGIKYRGLWLKMDPGSQATSERFINMQNDVNLTFFFDKKQKYTLVTTPSYTGIEPYYGKTNTWFMKEYYLRYKQSNNLWWYVGQMDKAFGLRNVDHTAVNRRVITLGQFDQSQGVIAHFTYPDWDIAANVFFGNGAQEEPEKQKGYSVTGEYQVFEKFKIGGSFLSSESEQSKWNLLAFTTRMGLSKGSAIMAEAGFKERTNKLSGADAMLGTYALVETLVNVRRGYNILSVVEHSKEDIKKSSPEVMKWSLGALMFPLPRLELRAMATNAKVYADQTGSQDAWALQGQVHVSY
ncbi:hypothetical protein [Bdellovibrio bacteriovorus]|uniref:hypothetical protein n=1 Tax=Bdellovibrio bacteriovorus TaxID=959 RepID=UPI0035A6952D